jgi:galactokinase/mevalonate kinase-like predicted kinase
LVSDPARPESAGHAALTELASVIRNVTEQLAGFRRRALAAESRVRELEQSAATAEQSVRELAARSKSLEAAMAEARQHAARVHELEGALVEAQKASEAALQVPARSPAGSGGGPASKALVAENEALRERLGEAVERTRVIAERVRFLRQQLGNGGDK